MSLKLVRELERQFIGLGPRLEVLAEIDRRAEVTESCAPCGAEALVRPGQDRPRSAAVALQRLLPNLDPGHWDAARPLPQARGVPRLAGHPPAPVPRSCRALARQLGCDKTTIRRWRMAILGALGAGDAAPLGGIVEADQTSHRESRKGSRE